MSRAQVSEAVQIQNGFAFESELFSERRIGLPVARIRDVVRGYSETYYTGEYPKEYEIGNGDLLIGMDGEFNVGIWRGGRALLNQRVCKIIPKDGVADKHFLKHRLALLVKQIEAATPYVTVKHLSSEELKAEQIELPPLAEQKLIAAILEKADRLRRTRRYARQLSDRFLQSVFLEMFGDPIKNPKGWSRASLAEVGRVVTGSTPPSVKQGMFGGAIPFVTPGDLEIDTSNTVRFVTDAGAKQSRLVRKGSTLVCCIGATIGKTDQAQAQSAFNQQINAVEWNANVDDDYGLQVMRFFSKEVAARGRSTTLPILKKSEFEEIAVPVPPLPLQQKFADIVRRFEGLRSQQREAERQAEHLFQTLLHRAFNGGAF